jgi:glycosyltransferase involved in cell wall biosynthesis
LPSLSVIIPNYNHGKFLPSSLGAIAPQLRAGDELIVLDDASTDDSREIISEFARQFQQIKPVFAEKNSGIVDTIHRGIALAKNEYIYFGAADDYVLPGFVETLMAAAGRHPRAGIIAADPGYHHHGAETFVMAPLQLGGREYYFDPQAVVTVGKVLEAGIGLTTVASIVRREAFIEAGYFDPALEFCSDWFCLYVIAFRDGFAYVPHKGAVMRVDPTTYSSVGWSSRERRHKVLLARAIMSEPYRDVRSAFAESGVLKQFQPDILWLALRNRDVRNLTLIGDIWFGLKSGLRRFGVNRLVPKPLKVLRRRWEAFRFKRTFNVDA